MYFKNIFFIITIIGCTNFPNKANSNIEFKAYDMALSLHNVCCISNEYSAHKKNRSIERKDLNIQNQYYLTIEIENVIHNYGYVGDYVNHWYQIGNDLYNIRKQLRLKVSYSEEINIISTSCDCNEKHVDRDDEYSRIAINKLNLGINRISVTTDLYENRGKYAGHSAQYQFQYKLTLEKLNAQTNLLNTKKNNSNSDDFSPSKYLEEYFATINTQNYSESIEYFANDINRYYDKTNTNKLTVYESMNSYRTQSRINEIFMDIDFNSINSYKSSNGNTKLEVKMNYKINREDKNKPSNFKLILFFELNRQNKIISLHERIVDKS